MSNLTSRPIGGNYLDRGTEYTSALERWDELRRRLHAAQVAGNQGERERLQGELQHALDIVNILKEVEARDWMRGLRLSRELYEPQLRFHLECLVEDHERFKAIERRVDLVEDAVVDLTEGVRA